VFVSEEFRFALEAPTITGGGLVRTHGAVAGHDEGEAVFGASVGDGTGGARGVNFSGDFGIGARLTGGNLLQCVPDAQLKDGAAQIDWDGGRDCRVTLN